MSAQKLADAFARKLREALCADEFAEMRRRNATEQYENACASHDFIDANVVMDEAHKEVFGRSALDGSDAQQERAQAVWNAAWDIAKSQHLTSKESVK